MSIEQTPTGSTPTSTPSPSLGEQLRSNMRSVMSSESSQAPQATASTSVEPNRGEVQSPDPIENESQNQPVTDQLPEQEQNTNAANLDTDGKPKHISRGEKRFQEMANKNKALEAKVAELEAKFSGKAPDAAKQPETPALAPNKPQAPKFERPKEAPQFNRHQLEEAELIGRQNGNEELLRSVAAERQKLNQHDEWKQYDAEDRLWKLENEGKIKSHEETVKHYRTEAVKKWPDLAKSDSPIFQMFQKVSSQAPEILKRSTGDGEYILAEVAATYVRNQELESKLAALEKNSKQIETENTGLKKKIAPVVQKQSLNLGAQNGRKLTASEELRQRMGDLQSAGRLG